MAEKQFDNFQKAAINANLNSVVSAGAGSGKTTVLAERFSRLVLEKNYNVDEILTLTFTKKATTEMSERIYKVLKANAPDKAANFYKNNIKTLDSYCSALAKLGSHFYGLSPDFTQDDDEVEKRIKNMALPFILEKRDNDAIKALVQANTFDKIADEIFVEPMMEQSFVASPVDFEKCEKSQKAEIIKAWKENCEKADEIFSNLKIAFSNFEGKKDGVFYTKLSENLKNNVVSPPLLSESDVENANYEGIFSYTNFIKTLAFTSQSGTASEKYAEVKNCLNELREISGVLVSIVNYVYSFKISHAIFPLMSEFQKKVNDAKREMAVLTFGDVANLALKILIEHPEIRKIEKMRYKAIMIDEFQDNNKMQRDLLFLLSEKMERNEKSVPEASELIGDKLFFVGDEKQSIYKFRGADVSVFRSLSNDFENGNLSMTNNYRSKPNLINAFNTIFGGSCGGGDGACAVDGAVFYKKGEKLPDGHDISKYEATYENATVPDVKNEADNNKRVHFAIYYTKNPRNFSSEGEINEAKNADEKFLTEENAESQWVAKKIEELVTVGVNGEKYKYEDIAILFRSYSLQPLYERTFLNNGIPYDAEVVTGFFADGVVNDIFSFLKICVDENDVLSYLKVLCSPWLNFSSEVADKIIEINAKPFSADVFQLDGFDEKTKERYEEIKKFYENLRETSKYESLTKTVSRLWYESGYRYETIWNKKVSMFAKLYDVIFELARKCDEKNMSLSNFVDSAEIYKDTDDTSDNGTKKIENMNIPLETTGGVHILSIHKSKGLEFPVVFVCGSHKFPKNSGNAKAAYPSKDFGIAINTPDSPFDKKNKYASNYFYEVAKELEKSQSQAELRRLVYVAVTRAKNEVFITNGKFSSPKFTKDGQIETDKSPKDISTIFGALKPFFEANANYEKVGGDDKSPICRIAANPSAPFSLDFILPCSRVAENEKSTARKNTFSSKVSLINEIATKKIYENACIIEKDDVDDRYLSPSHLQGRTNFSSESVASETNATSGAEVASIDLPNYFTDGHHEADFGTIAHEFLEMAINGEEFKMSQKAIFVVQNLTHKKSAIDETENICKKMAETFKSSQLGKKAISSTWRKTEYPFKSNIEIDGNKKIAKGTIDLVFKDENGDFIIVDYKTDQKIAPEQHKKQLDCYKNAVAKMQNVSSDKVKGYLYYLRFGEVVEISE